MRVEKETDRRWMFALAMLRQLLNGRESLLAGRTWQGGNFSGVFRHVKHQKEIQPEGHGTIVALKSRHLQGRAGLDPALLTQLAPSFVDFGVGDVGSPLRETFPALAAFVRLNPRMGSDVLCHVRFQPGMKRIRVKRTVEHDG